MITRRFSQPFAKPFTKAFRPLHAAKPVAHSVRVGPTELKVIDIAVPAEHPYRHLLTFELGAPDQEAIRGLGWEGPGLLQAQPLHPSFIAGRMYVTLRQGMAAFFPYSVGKGEWEIPAAPRMPAVIVAPAHLQSFNAAAKYLQKNRDAGQAFFLNDPVSTFFHSRFVYSQVQDYRKTDFVFAGGPLDGEMRLRKTEERVMYFPHAATIGARRYAGNLVYAASRDKELGFVRFDIAGIQPFYKPAANSCRAVSLSGGPLDGGDFSFRSTDDLPAIIEIHKRVEIDGEECSVILNYAFTRPIDRKRPQHQALAVFTGFSLPNDALRFRDPNSAVITLTDGPLKDQKFAVAPGQKWLRVGHSCEIRDEVFEGTAVYRIFRNKVVYHHMEMAFESENPAPAMPDQDMVALGYGPLGGKAFRFKDGKGLQPLMAFRRVVRIDGTRQEVDLYYALSPKPTFGIPSAQFVGFAVAKGPNPDTKRPANLVRLVQ